MALDYIEDKTPDQKLDYIEEPQQSSGSQNWVMQNIINPAEKIPGDIGTGIARGMANLINLPLNLTGIRHKVPEPVDINTMLGLKNNAADQFIQSASSYVPTALGSETAAPLSLVKTIPGLMGKMGAEGATFQAQQPGSDATDVALAGGLSAALPGGMAGIRELGILGAAKYGLPAYAKRATDFIGQLSGLNNQNAFDVVKNKYVADRKIEDRLWENTNQVAEVVDKNINNNLYKKIITNLPESTLNELSPQQYNKIRNNPYILDRSSYLNPIENKLDQYKQDIEEHSPLADEYANPIKQMTGYLKDKVGTFSDAIKQNIALNKEYRANLRPNSGIPKSDEELNTTSFATNALHNMIDDNLDKYGLQNNLGNLWDQARGKTADIKQTYMTTPDVRGTPRRSIFSGVENTNNPYVDPTGFIKDYLPKGKQEGTQSMEQFTNMIGNKETANNYLKNNIFKDAVLNNGQVDPYKFSNIVNNLSTKQKSYLFNPDEIKKINLLNDLTTKYPNQTTSPLLSHSAPGAVLGGLASKILGIPWTSGALAGGIITPVAEKGVQAILSNKGINKNLADMLIERMNNPDRPIMGQTPVNLNRVLISQQPLVMNNGNQ